MIARYRKQPVVIEAVQWDGSEERWEEILGWVKHAPAAGAIYCTGQELAIETLEGRMTASPGDWIIKGVKGEFYPCKPDIFRDTYAYESAL
jgi:hypothetical protein